jgi:hypothetical protein
LEVFSVAEERYRRSPHRPNIHFRASSRKLPSQKTSAALPALAQPDSSVLAVVHFHNFKRLAGGDLNSDPDFHIRFSFSFCGRPGNSSSR